ncbi:hypothetical protein [Actinomadura rubrisoli]|uniref:Uncharacterized protein n=1 Tax=Actinomadura rubrisoli TaxID=2530368 RepID=A0A4R5C5G4_9ACTN|nr:hypothetical protein [Actinomadura rubrisoli]TDD93333.1 hypothetical protein E1298_10130 [Actinomadura rubrisoli]
MDVSHIDLTTWLLGSQWRMPDAKLPERPLPELIKRVTAAWRERQAKIREVAATLTVRHAASTTAPAAPVR